jgi:hypothetical protein
MTPAAWRASTEARRPLTSRLPPVTYAAMKPAQARYGGARPAQAGRGAEEGGA